MIKFGTSGFRGVIAKDFTFENIYKVTIGTAKFLKEKKLPLKVVVGYDTRFLSDIYAKFVTTIFKNEGFKTLLVDNPSPTALVAYEIIRNKLAGGVVITASHNPYIYNGYKFNSSWGGPALPEETSIIEKYANQAVTPNLDIEYIIHQKINTYNPKKEYFKLLKKLIDFKKIKNADYKFAYDPLFGAGSGFLDELLNEYVKVFTIHNYKDPYFGGLENQEPAGRNLDELNKITNKYSCILGLSTDPDADRFGIVDNKNYYTPNELLALYLYYILEVKNPELRNGVVVRSFVTTSMLDRIAKNYGATILETPVGFKYIGEALIKESKFILGGEESGGVTINGGLPEKDGILGCLLACEIVSHFKKPLSYIFKDMYRKFGMLYSKRVNIKIHESKIDILQKRFMDIKISKVDGMKVKEIKKYDGIKFIMENSWFAMRVSGTEPVVRLYVETDKKEKLKILEKYVRKKLYELTI
ncbi:MAG: phosphoglucomutase/phosphomannomutase family protein [bacterium]|nr:phosphoglucomutase/phosphomannomutase family protein [bacterium]